MSAEAQLTPMMAQYRRIKGELPKDALLLFRLGDFYEMFFEDAQAGAQLLNLSLTARNGIADVRPAASRGEWLHRPDFAARAARWPSAIRRRRRAPAN